MNVKNRLLVLLALVVLVLGMVACSTPAATTGGTESDTPGETGATTGEPAETGETAGEGEHEHGRVVVSSKGFTEAFILGEMYALLLENHGYEVERKLGLGSETIVTEAMRNGEVDLYPEYTSTGLLAVLGMEAMTDRVAIYDTVKAEYESQYQITWLDAAPFNNTQALAVTQETSDRLSLTTVSQLLELAPELRIGGAPEFFERDDGLPGLNRVYGDMAFAEEVQVDSGLRYQSLLDGEIDVVVAYGTDGQIGGYDLVVLEDDMGLWPPYQVAPVIRQETLTAFPDIADLLNPLAPLLTDQVMADLNWMVDGPEGMEPAAVARQFLTEQGLIQ